jgi:hypothetical protein
MTRQTHAQLCAVVRSCAQLCAVVRSCGRHATHITDLAKLHFTVHTHIHPQYTQYTQLASTTPPHVLRDGGNGRMCASLQGPTSALGSGATRSASTASNTCCQLDAVIIILSACSRCPTVHFIFYFIFATRSASTACNTCCQLDSLVILLSACPPCPTVRLYIYMYICIYIHTYAYIHTYIHTYIQTYINAYICVCARVCVCVCVCVY